MVHHADFCGEPVFFLRHGYDGMRAESLTPDDIIDAMENGKATRRRSGRVEVAHRVGERIVLVRYDQEEVGYIVVSVSQRRA